MDFETIYNWFFKIAGVIDTMFFIAYTISQIIEWFKNKRA